MTTVTSTLDIVLKDDVSANAKKVTAALEAAERQAKAIDGALSRSNLGEKMQSRLKAMGASAVHIDAVSARFQELAKAQGFAGKAANEYSKDQAAAAKNFENVSIATTRAIMGQERAQEAARIQAQVRAEQRDAADAKRRIDETRKTAEQEARERKRIADQEERDRKRDADQIARDRKREADDLARDQRRVAEQGERDRLRSAERAARDRASEAREEERERRRRAEQEAHLREQERHAIERGGFGHYLAGSAAAAVTAHSVMGQIEKGVEAGAERQHVRVGMSNAGIPPDEIARAQILAQQVARVAPNMTVSDIMELHKEARSAVQHPDEVFELLPDLARAASVLKGMNVQDANIADIVKGGESLGLMSHPERFHEYLSGQIKAMSVMGKTITTSQVYEAAKYSKATGSTLSDDFLNLVMPSLIQEMHGSSAGDALTGLNKRFRGGLMHQHLAAVRMNEMGLLDDPSKIIRNKTGEIIGYSGKVKDDDLLTKDPAKWFQTVYKTGAAKVGATSQADINKLLAETLPSVAANLGRILIQQEDTLAQHRRNYEAAPGLDEAVKNQQSDPKVATQTLTSSINDLMAAVTAPAMSGAAKGINAIAASIRDLADAASQHPAAAPIMGALAAAGTLAGSGWLSYKLGTGAVTRFGSLLRGAATAETVGAGLAGRAAALPVLAGPASGLGFAGAAGLAAGGLGLYSLARAAEQAHIFDEQKRSGVAGVVEFLDSGLANRIYGPADGDTPFRGRPAFPHTPTPSPSFSDAYLGGERQAIDERARRSADDFRRDPEGARGRAMMHGADTNQLDAVKQKADEAHAAIDQINATPVAPQVNTAGLDAAIAKMRELVALASQVSAAASATGAAQRTAYRGFRPAPAGRTTV